MPSFSREDDAGIDYSAAAIYRRCRGGSLQNAAASFRQSAWNIDDAGIRKYDEILGECASSEQISREFKNEVRRQEIRPDALNVGCSIRDEVNAEGRERITHQDQQFALDVWPHFAKMAAGKISRQEFGVIFKGLCAKHHLKLDLSEMGRICGVDI